MRPKYLQPLCYFATLFKSAQVVGITSFSLFMCLYLYRHIQACKKPFENGECFTTSRSVSGSKNFERGF